MIEATLLDKEEFDYTLAVQAEQEARDRAAAEAKKSAQTAYKEELQVRRQRRPAIQRHGMRPSAPRASPTPALRPLRGAPLRRPRS